MTKTLLVRQTPKKESGSRSRHADILNHEKSTATKSAQSLGLLALAKGRFFAGKPFQGSRLGYSQGDSFGLFSPSMLVATRAKTCCFGSKGGLDDVDASHSFTLAETRNRSKDEQGSARSGVSFLSKGHGVRIS